MLYGGAKAAGKGFEGPETFKRVWRHVVDLSRAHGATNILWAFHVMDFSMPNDKWNLAAQYYPGPDYVDWLGFSLYGNQFPSDNGWSGFTECFDWPYTEPTLLDPTKPIMFCEFGVGEFPHKGDKAAWIREAFTTIADRKKISPHQSRSFLARTLDQQLPRRRPRQPRKRGPALLPRAPYPHAVAASSLSTARMNR